MVQNVPGGFIPLNDKGNFAALAYTYVDSKKTEVYDCVYAAKFNHTPWALEKLAEKCGEFFEAYPQFIKVDYICAVPAHHSKNYDLPRTLANQLSENFKIPDLTSQFSFSSTKQSARSLPLQEKKKNWEEAGVIFTGNDLTGKKILLIDDTVQSKTSVRHIAKILKSAGMEGIYCLCMVKTWSDSDNL